MDQIVTVTVADPEGTDVREVLECVFEVASGADENRVSFTCASGDAPDMGGYVYIDGTGYGGTVDEVKAQTTAAGRTVTCSGRSWEGVLAGKRLLPDSGSGHLTVSGASAGVLRSLIERIGLGDVMEVDPSSEGEISGYSFDRFTDAYTGIRAMLRASGLKPVFRRSGGKTVLAARRIADYGSKLDSDRMDFTISRIGRRVNHLVCAGGGELADRAVAHFYADAGGSVSKTQTLFGVDEIAALYDYTNADEEQLEEDGRKKLAEMQGQGTLEADAREDLDADIGDVLAGRDNATGQTVTAEVTKKVTRVEMGLATYSYELGTATAGTSGSTISGTAEGGGGVSYIAGRGISIASRTISAEVAREDLDATNERLSKAERLAGDASSAIAGASLTMGAVETLEPGAAATASLTGSALSHTLSLGIPRGERGLTGETGPRGATGPAGPQGPKGEPGGEGPTGPTGPQGEVGPRGPQGIQGPKGDAGQAGPQGESGVTAPASGLFTVSVDPGGDLWCTYPDSDDPPPVSYDAATGDLYYEIPEA